jgi:hypothetical protein
MLAWESLQSILVLQDTTQSSHSENTMFSLNILASLFQMPVCICLSLAWKKISYIFGHYLFSFELNINYVKTTEHFLCLWIHMQLQTFNRMNIIYKKTMLLSTNMFIEIEVTYTHRLLCNLGLIKRNITCSLKLWQQRYCIIQTWKSQL